MLAGKNGAKDKPYSGEEENKVEQERRFCRIWNEHGGVMIVLAIGHKDSQVGEEGKGTSKATHDKILPRAIAEEITGMIKEKTEDGDDGEG
jgi:hypothetical protein